MPTSSASTTDSAKSAGGGVQSLERAFDLLERMADAGGEVGLSELSASSGLPLPTIHRLMRTLVLCGYVRHPLQQVERALEGLDASAGGPGGVGGAGARRRHGAFLSKQAGRAEAYPAVG